MRQFWKNIRRNLKSISRVGLFIATIVIILLLYPNIKRFKYEYPKGRPWSYETLMAPFNFPIYKSDKELNAERDSLLKDIKPYYRFNKNIVGEKLSVLDASFSHDSILLPAVKNIINDIYFQGVLFLDEAHKEDSRILVLTDNIANERAVKDMFSSSSASAFLQKKAESFSDSNRFLLESMLTDEHFFTANILYDKEYSDKLINNIESEVLPTKGMIQANELIVLKGDIIDNEKYQILASLEKEYSKRLGTSEGQNYILAGHFLLIFFSVLILFLFLTNYRKSVINSNRKLLLVLLFIILFVAITVFVLKFPLINIYVIPFALIAIVIRTFIDSRTALFAFVVTILLISFLVPNSYEFLFIQVVTGIISVLSLSRLQRRSQLFFAALFVFLTYSVLYLAFHIIQEGSLYNINWKTIGWFAINGALLTIAYLLLYVIEKLFGFLSDITLIELSNTNNKLLRKLTQAAPGTFQHSLQVANLAEEAVYAIGGNPLLIRTGALYHDIGKMKKPVFFVENQHVNLNPHIQLKYEESAGIIIDHVKEGIRLAKKYNLPEKITDFIRTHHGKGRAEFFFRSFKNDFPNKEMDESVFTYPGPDPFTKEQAILMMADSCEAASRSLLKKNEESIRNLVSKIIDTQTADGRFNNAPITFQDIKKIKDIFVRMLQTIYHVRVGYPDEK